MPMIEATQPALSGWESFYVIVGSSGAALIGLQFVVIALIKDTEMRTAAGSLSAFGTPTVVHFGGALLISTVMSAPWPTLFGVSTVLAICGVAGLGFSATVVVRTQRQTNYEPVMEDWLWYIILPTCAYATLTLGALFLRSRTVGGLFAIAGAALGLLFIAIHNAWDTVTYIVLSPHPEETAEKK